MDLSVRGSLSVYKKGGGKMISMRKKGLSRLKGSAMMTDRLIDWIYRLDCCSRRETSSISEYVKSERRGTQHRLHIECVDTAKKK